MSEALKPEAVPLQKSDIVIVEWENGRYIGKPAVQARNIIEPDLQHIRTGSKLKIKMGKSASAKVWNAVFIGKQTDDKHQIDVDMDVTPAESSKIVKKKEKKKEVIC